DAVAEPAIKARLLDLGGLVMPPNTPADFGKFIAADTEKWIKVVKFANLKPEGAAGDSDGKKRGGDDETRAQEIFPCGGGCYRCGKLSSFGPCPQLSYATDHDRGAVRGRRCDRCSGSRAR